MWEHRPCPVDQAIFTYLHIYTIQQELLQHSEVQCQPKVASPRLSGCPLLVWHRSHILQRHGGDGGIHSLLVGKIPSALLCQECMTLTGWFTASPGASPLCQKGGSTPKPWECSSFQRAYNFYDEHQGGQEGCVCKMQPGEQVKGPFFPRKNTAKCLHPKSLGVSAVSLALTGLSILSGVKVHPLNQGHLLPSEDKEPWYWVED